MADSHSLKFITYGNWKQLVYINSVSETRNISTRSTTNTFYLPKLKDFLKIIIIFAVKGSWLDLKWIRKEVSFWMALEPIHFSQHESQFLSFVITPFLTTTSLVRNLYTFTGLCSPLSHLTIMPLVFVHYIWNFWFELWSSCQRV